MPSAASVNGLRPGKIEALELEQDTTPSTYHYSIADKDTFWATARLST